MWTTFNSWQWDVDWSNPDVVCEYAEIVLHLANLGVEVLRLDAIAFIWKRLGTTSQNQPEVHAITQVLRAVARIACPAVVFLAEAIVSPTDLVPYLGTGARSGKVSDLAYHNSLMVQLWSMLAGHEVELAVHTAAGHGRRAFDDGLDHLRPRSRRHRLGDRRRRRRRGRPVRRRPSGVPVGLVRR